MRRPSLTHVRRGAHTFLSAVLLYDVSRGGGGGQRTRNFAFFVMARMRSSLS